MQSETLDQLALGISGLADAVRRAAREQRISFWANMLVGGLVCVVGAMTMIELRGAVRELHVREQRLAVWEERQVIHERRVSRALDVSQVVVSSLQGLIDSETAKNAAEKQRALAETERLALLGQAKAISAAIEDVRETVSLAKSERRPAPKAAAASVDVLQKRLSVVMKKAAEKGHDLRD